MLGSLLMPLLGFLVWFLVSRRLRDMELVGLNGRLWGKTFDEVRAAYPGGTVESPARYTLRRRLLGDGVQLSLHFGPDGLDQVLVSRVPWTNARDEARWLGAALGKVWGEPKTQDRFGRASWEGDDCSGSVQLPVVEGRRLAVGVAAPPGRAPNLEELG